MGLRKLDGIMPYAYILVRSVPIHDESNHLQPHILVFSFQRRDAALLCVFLHSTAYSVWIVRWHAERRGKSGTKACGVCVCEAWE